MIEIKKKHVLGWETAIREMWGVADTMHASDSFIGENGIVLGARDLSHMRAVIKANNGKSEFLRFVSVLIEVTAPLYWWREYDAYKTEIPECPISALQNCDIKAFELDDFSHEHLNDVNVNVLRALITRLNAAWKSYLETREKSDLWQVIQLLPESYNQKRLVAVSYEDLRKMFFERNTHILDEWVYFCEWITDMDYAKELLCERLKGEKKGDNQ